jgi:hypothetical protein
VARSPIEPREAYAMSLGRGGGVEASWTAASVQRQETHARATRTRTRSCPTRGCSAQAKTPRLPSASSRLPRKAATGQRSRARRQQDQPAVLEQGLRRGPCRAHATTCASRDAGWGRPSGNRFRNPCSKAELVKLRMAVAGMAATGSPSPATSAARPACSAVVPERAITITHEVQHPSQRSRRSRRAHEGAWWQAGPALVGQDRAAQAQ